ncbi:MAG: hypothetical protein HOF69_04305 [Campylobacteraceae bacterium]|jgi:GGDEF domain-containing protein|nr:hypothetical protein [Campylobacteraceae bacterium]MBT4030032.1 hypothetical protein [Campylobacteraceae bacterium]MBT4179081.1 hypothetical protein [Campylobacteraceae bacterium]MBT4572352.1 hypothetical protein [Campylobacteraceae bacterium]MBT5983471.1 hypothetical protein [Campylobacteraceae bacterium]
MRTHNDELVLILLQTNKSLDRVSKIIHSQIKRKSDIIEEMEDNKFAITVHVSLPEDAMSIALRIKKDIESTLNIKVNIGISYAKNSEDDSKLLSQANRALEESIKSEKIIIIR